MRKAKSPSRESVFHLREWKVHLPQSTLHLSKRTPPPPGGTVLTDAQWQALANLGIIAVHNPAGEGKALNKAAEIVEATRNHHLFSKFRKNPEYGKFWKEVFGNDFNIEDFTVPVKKGQHLSDARNVTDQWKGFIDEQRTAIKSGAKTVQQIQKETVEKALDIAEQRGYDISKIRPYRGNKELGSSLDDLYKFANAAEKIDLTKNTSRVVRWKSIFKSAGKRLGKSVVKVMPGISHAMTAAAVIKAVSDPAGALADSLGVSRETAGDIIDGHVSIGISFWNSGEVVDSAELSDGRILTVGEQYFVWKTENLNPPPPFGPPPAGHQNRIVLRWVKAVRITEIRTTDVAGKVMLELDDGSPNGFSVKISELQDVPNVPLAPN